MSKYHSQKVTVDGIEFDSKKEANRYMELSLLEKAGAISDLERQVKFELIPVQKEVDTITTKGAYKRGKVNERACYYVADFRYMENGQVIVEDVKGMKTEVYKIKRKLMLHKYGIRIREV